MATLSKVLRLIVVAGFVSFSYTIGATMSQDSVLESVARSMPHTAIGQYAATERCARLAESISSRSPVVRAMYASDHNMPVDYWSATQHAGIAHRIHFLFEMSALAQ